MVCSKADSSNQMKMDSGAESRADQNTGASREIDILTPDGKTLNLSIGDNTEIRGIKNECELLCGIPSDLQSIQLQGRDLGNDRTLSSLDISDGCTLRITVPQWWQKFVSTCYKGDTQQVRKRIYVKMSQVSREKRSFTAAFIAAVKGNHNLMFAAFAGRRINLHSKTKMSGRNLLHAAVSGGSTSCVANILMNGGNALLDAPDNTGETPVKMAKKLYGEAGDMVKFLNVYLELHRRETKQSGFSNRYWDNLEKNNNSSDAISLDNEEYKEDEDLSRSSENLITELGDLNLNQDEPTRTDFTETEFLTNNSNQRCSSVTKVNIEDYDANVGHNSLAVTSGFSKFDEKQQNNGNPINLSCNEQSCGQKSDTGYYSSCNQSIGKEVTETFWNEDLFAQTNAPTEESELTKQELNLGEQTAVDAVEDATNNLSILSADPSIDRVSGSSLWPKPRRRAQQRKQVFLEQRRKRSTTERPNLEELMKMRSDSITNESQKKEETEEAINEARDKEQISESRENESPITAGDVINVWQTQENVPVVNVTSSRDSSDICHSPKPPRRAQLRKKSIVEQRRKRSMVERPNIEELDTSGQNNQSTASDKGNAEGTNGMLEQKTECDTSDNHERNVEHTSSGRPEQRTECNTGVNFEQNNEGNICVNFQQHTERPPKTETLEGESPVAKYVLRLWQDQAEAAALSGEESDAGRSPKLLRRAFRRKQVFMEQRRKKSATERPNILKLINRKVDDDEDASKDAEIASEDDRKVELSGAENDVSVSLTRQENVSSVTVAYDLSMKVESSEEKEISQLPSQLPTSEQNKERVPIRTAQRCSNTGPLLNARAKKNMRPISLSSVSGEESSGSDQEKVVKETVAPINSLAKTQRRRRLPLLPNKRIKLPVIKIEDSGTSRGYATIKTPHPPLSRSRSGSTCSEDSVSSIEMPSEGASEGEISNKSFPVKQRRRSVPSSPVNFNQPTFRTRKDSIQVEEIEEQGLGISPQLRARLQLRDQPRENLPWNEWRTKVRSGSLPGKSSENSAAQYMKQKELSQQNTRLVAWNEKKRPQTARHGTSRMSFTELPDKKEGSEKIRPMTARARSEQDLKEDLDHERQLHKSKRFEEWLLQKDQEALEQEQMLRRKAKIKFQRAHKNK